jgi:thiol-disulfide isomerase/thioredoxin
MNKHLKALCIVLGLAALTLAIYLGYRNKTADGDVETATGSALTLNQVAQDFDGKTLLNQPIKLSQYKGKVVILNFWASWCGPCIEEMPSLIKLTKAFPQEVELVAISGDSTLADIESFIKSFPDLKTVPNIHVVFDEDKSLSQKYQIFRLPESFILDQEQKVVKKISGTIDWNTPDALEYMKQLVVKNRAK